MKLFPKESADELYDTLIAVLWVVGILVVGTVIIWLLGFLINVSVRSPLGIGGAGSVVLLATGVGVGVFLSRRRKQHGIMLLRDKQTVQFSGDDGTATIVRRVSRPTRPASPQAKDVPNRPVDALNPHNADELFQLKRQLADALEKVDFDQAERILLRIQEAEDQRDWCQIQREAVQLKRRRKA